MEEFKVFKHSVEFIKNIIQIQGFFPLMTRSLPHVGSLTFSTHWSCALYYMQPAHTCLYMVILVYIKQKLYWVSTVSASNTRDRKFYFVPVLHPSQVRFKMIRVTGLYDQQLMHLYCRYRFSERLWTRMWGKETSVRQLP